MSGTLASFGLLVVGASASFDPLHHLGGNGPWFRGPNVFDISPDPPGGCVVDQAAFTSRHGSRYPDPGAYGEWTNLSAKAWEPVVRNPELELSMLSLGGWKELYDMGVQYRWKYPGLYDAGAPFILWANHYGDDQPRVVDSAKLFACGYLGPESTELGSIYVLNNSDPRSIANSLAPSDLCPNYNDTGGGTYAETWADTYLPPIAKRINSKLSGLKFNTSDVGIFPYLCGFETHIVGHKSPWCDVFTNEEILQYEYAQDLRYYWGVGPGTSLEKNLMLPFLTAVVQRFVDGPNATYRNDNSSTAFKPNPLIATFTNDGQLNQLIAGLGIFDDEADLPGTHILESRTYKSSHFTTMRGTVGLERLNCGPRGLFMRIKLNDQVYPISSCQGGPGRSCSLKEYQQFIMKKSAAFGSFSEACGIPKNMTNGEEKTTFLTNPDLPFEYVVRP